ncbi:MAG TPA: thiamine pyrophosphate-dependent enzyme, partial [Planctomycetota bacterium]|nr:thiamine pyrophosphate-dependent enzyme [Planctomycetota bacterium]
MSIDTNPNRVAVVEGNLDRYLAEASPAARALAPDAPLRAGAALSARAALALFEDQVTSRALDVVARELKREGAGFYTISSAGHEQNAVVGSLLRTDDPCVLHYRSGALMLARARRAGGETPVFDTLLGLVASSDDPSSGGRHKVWGSARTWVPPQTSTIASHLPKAVGTAFAISRARRMGRALPIASDAIVCCSFGDASTSHATALTGINAARYAARGGRPTPILFVCEDNRIGISVETPSGWIAERFGGLPHLTYVHAEGDLDGVHARVAEAVHLCRTRRTPVFLHLSTVRLWGHAGSDVETTYHTWEEIAAIETRDPLLANARLLVECGAAAPSELAALVAEARERVRAAAREAVRRPRLTSRAQ